jgi:putative FmdB family regulatory protein
LPLYPYRCTKCGYQFEKIQSFNSQPETECPECGGILERPLTAPGLQFKGAGWYVTDYASKSAGSGSPSKESGAAETKSAAESKPAASEKPASSGSSDGSSSGSSSSTPASSGTGAS